MLKFIFTFFVSVIVSSAAFSADNTQTIRFAGTARTFSIHVPNGSAPKGGFPVILAFHGGGMQGAGMKRVSGLDGAADRKHFIVIYPDGLDKHWNDGRSTIRNPHDDVGFIAALLDLVEKNYPVNKNKVFATGLSNGALFAQRLGCDLSQRIAAIAPVAGTLPAEMIRSCRPGHAVAVMQISGTADPIMPYDGGLVQDFGGRGEGGQVASVASTADFWAANNGCGSKLAPSRLPPVARLDPTRIVRTDYRGCLLAGKVTVLSVMRGGHVWPGSTKTGPRFVTGRPSRQLNATDAITDFFLSLPQR